MSHSDLCTPEHIHIYIYLHRYTYTGKNTHAMHTHPDTHIHTCVHVRTRSGLSFLFDKGVKHEKSWLKLNTHVKKKF